MKNKLPITKFIISRKDFNKISAVLEAVYENVDRFIKDAELLIEDESYNHAYALLVFAEEELSKDTLFIDYLTCPPKERKKSKRIIKSHHWKQLIMRMASTVTDNDHKKLFENIQTKKELALYTDIDEKANIRKCNVTKEEVTELLALVKRDLKYAKDVPLLQALLMEKAIQHSPSFNKIIEKYKQKKIEK